MIQPSMENFFSYHPMQFFLVSNMLTLGFVVMFAGIFYFVMITHTVAKRFQISSIISVLVMCSAFLLLYFQSQNWDNSFAYDSVTGMYSLIPGHLFTNSYRYVNWIINLPMLLYQILWIIDLEPSRRTKIRNEFFVLATLMMLTGYVGQFYEMTNMTYLWGWGLVSTLLFLKVLCLTNQVITSSYSYLHSEATSYMQSIWILFLISWWLYPIAYIIPAISGSAWAVVIRQFLFTAGNITSTLIFGVLLTQVAHIRSKKEGS